jgi:hypothetical protein
MDRRNEPLGKAPARAPAEATATGPTLTTPLVWAGGSLLLTASTFLVSVIAMFRAFGSLLH